MKPPKATAHPKVLETHGVQRTDEYYWMNDRENPEVIAYLEAENAYLEAELAHTKPLQEQLFAEIKGRMQPREESPPYQLDQWWYFSRYEEGKEHPIYLRRRLGEGQPEQVILDVNVLAEGKPFCQIMGNSLSVNHRYLAYATDYVGRRICDLKIRDLERNEDFPETITGVSGNITWALDHETIFYSKLDPDTLRAHQIWRHRLGSDPAEDVLVFEETDETFRCSVGRTKSRAYLYIHSGSTLTDEVRILPTNDPTGPFQVFSPRQRGLEYSIDHLDGQFFILTNREATNFRVMTCAEGQTDQAHWQELIPHREDTLIENFELYRQHLILEERRGGLTHLRILGRGDDPRDEYLAFHDAAYSTYLGYNPDPDRPVLRYGYESMTTPASVYERHLGTGEETTIWQKPVLGGFSADDYRSERLFATATDGTRVPISLVYHRDTPRDGSAPLLLYGYGSYGHSLDPYFSLSRLSLLNRGFIFAVAHIRGGSEMGRPWYENGRQLQKLNTFTDFIACAEHLLGISYTRKEHLYCMGGSAGGLLVGAVINLRPDLFHGAVAQVPFVDVVTTMLDDSIPLTTGEYDEWGNPHDKAYFDYILQYSPYDNVSAQDYPHLLVTSGLHDSQVQYWEPTKWVARLRDHKTDNHRLLLFTNMEAGHGGASGRFEAIKEIAMEYAFLLDLAGKDS